MTDTPPRPRRSPTKKAEQRAATLEQKGDGKAGKKASGLLMVGGVLYLWVRNAGNAQLAWSEDRGKTWAWADWKLTTSFGCPTGAPSGTATSWTGGDCCSRPTASRP